MVGNQDTLAQSMREVADMMMRTLASVLLSVIFSNIAQSQDLHWPFNEYGDTNEAEEASGGEPGLISGATRCRGWSGNALEFDGQGDAVQIGQNDSAPLIEPGDNFTISVWVNPSNLGKTGFQGIYGHYDELTLARSAYSLDIYQNRLVFFAGGGGDDYQAVYGLSPVLEENKWVHLAVVRNGDFIQGYINGEPYGTPPEIVLDGEWPKPNNAVGKRELVGARLQPGHASGAFEGKIDELKVWRRDLSEEELRMTFRGASEHWEFEEFVNGNTTYSVAGTPAESYGSATSTTGYGGQPGEALLLDGIGSVQIGPDNSEPFIQPNEDFTISVWLNPSDLDHTVYQGIYGHYDDHTQAKAAYSLDIHQKKIVFFAGGAGSSYQPVYGLSPVLEENKWVHLAVVRKGDFIQGYIDGEPYGTAQEIDLSGPWPMPNNESGVKRELVGVRGEPGNDSAFIGKIDELKVWKRALDATEVRSAFFDSMIDVVDFAGIENFNESVSSALHDTFDQLKDDGKTLLLRQGTWLAETQITLRSCTRLYAEPGTVLKNHGQDFVDVDRFLLNVRENCEVFDLTVDCGNLGIGGIQVSRTPSAEAGAPLEDILLQGCVVRNARSRRRIWGIWIRHTGHDCRNVTIRDCDVENIHHIGATLEASSTGIGINSFSDHPVENVLIKRCKIREVSSNNTRDRDADCINLQHRKRTEGIDAVTIVDCLFSEFSKRGVKIQGPGVYVSNNIIFSTPPSEPNMAFAHRRGIGVQGDHNVVEGNYIDSSYNVKSTGISFTTADYNRVFDNTILLSSTPEPIWFSCSGFLLGSRINNANAPCTNNLIVGNRVRDGNHGLHNRSGDDDVEQLKNNLNFNLLVGFAQEELDNLFGTGAEATGNILSFSESESYDIGDEAVFEKTQVKRKVNDTDWQPVGPPIDWNPPQTTLSWPED